MESLTTLIVAASAAYVSTNVDGYALLLGFFSNERYRAVEIVVGQFISMAAQLALSAAIMQLGLLKEAPLIGLAGVVPLTVGLMRIADLRRRGDVRTGETRHRSQSRNGCAGRIAAVAVVATSGAIDNVLVYASVLAGRASLEFLLVASAFGVLTALLCAGALLTARSRVSATTVQRATGCVAPFFTTAIGVALLIRFDTLPWIYSFA